MRASTGPSANPSQSATLQRTYEKLTETFSELSSTNNFKIPTVWEMEYSYTGPNRILLWKWTTQITDLETNLGSQNAPGSE